MRLLSVFAMSMVVWLGQMTLSLEAQSTNRPEFEVASIKPHPPSDGPPGSSMSDEHGRAVYRNVTVRTLIRRAYDGLKVYPLSTGPDPLSTDRYDIVAKAAGDPSREQTMLMLRTLLADRFALTVHRETKELPIYALVQGKSKPKLREVQDDGTEAEINSGGNHQIRAHHVPMSQLATTLRSYIGDNVVDETGLTGLFDFNLDFKVDESLAAEGLTIFEAVQQQLGLKLEARKGPVEVIVIDHVEKPTAD